MPRRSQAFAGALHALVLKFLHGQVEDAKALCNRLAGGELSSSPFDEVALDSLRDDWCKLLGGSDWKHYEPKVKHRRFDDDLPEWDRANYASAQLSSQQLLEKFRSEVDLGRMQATTLGALKEKYPEDRIRIASMGAIQKGDGSVRPVHDATRRRTCQSGDQAAKPVGSPGTGRRGLGGSASLREEGNALRHNSRRVSSSSLGADTRARLVLDRL